METNICSLIISFLKHKVLRIKRKRKKKLSTFKENQRANAEVNADLWSSWRSKLIQELHTFNVTHAEANFKFFELSTAEVTIHIQHKEAMQEAARSFVEY